MQNTSGQGKTAIIPAELDRWNWAAFLLNWIWGIGNNTFIALLMFVPLVNMAMPFVLGAKGNAWAWRNKRWENIEHFKRVQRQWALWAVAVYLVLIGLFVALFFFIMALLQNSDAYQLGVAKLRANSEAANLLGTPISTGYPMGSIEVSGPRGKADLSFSAEGPKSKGTVHMDATKDLGAWKINRIQLEVGGRSERIDLNQ